MTATANPYKLSVAIMTHPARLSAAQMLADRIADLSPELVVDSHPTGSTIENSIRSWNAVADDATHHLVLQDDCVVTDDFGPAVHAAIAEQPDAAVALFATWSSRTSNMVRIAALRGFRWAEVCDVYLPCVALVLPAPVARSFSRNTFGPHHIHDDFALAEHVDRQGVRALVHIPNLVQHAEIPTVAGNHVGTRRSVLFEQDITESNTGKGVLEGTRLLPHFSWSKEAGNWLYRDDPASGWSEVAGERPLLTHLGFDVSALRAEFTAAQRRRPRVSGLVSDDALFALWLTAFGIGLSTAGASEFTIGSAAARAALETLAPGAWRMMVDDRLVTPRRTALAEFFTRAADAGRTAAERAPEPYELRFPLPSALLEAAH